MASGLPFQFTAEVDTKPVSVTVTDRATEPAVALVGVIDARVGTGMPAFTVKLNAEEVLPPGGRIRDGDVRSACRGDLRCGNHGRQLPTTGQARRNSRYNYSQQSFFLVRPSVEALFKNREAGSVDIV